MTFAEPVASVLTLLLVLYGFRLICTPLLGPPGGRLASGPLPRPGEHRSRWHVDGFLAFALVFRFVWHLQQTQTVPFESALLVGAALIVGMAIVPQADRLVSVAALIVFFIEERVLYQGRLLLWFACMFAIHALIRGLVGRH